MLFFIILATVPSSTKCILELGRFIPKLSIFEYSQNRAGITLLKKDVVKIALLIGPGHFIIWAKSIAHGQQPAN